MKTLLAPLAALAFLASAAAAQAEELTGRVTAVDRSGSQFILDDGTIIRVAEGVSMDGLMPGTEVTVAFEERDGELIATELVPAE